MKNNSTEKSQPAAQDIRRIFGAYMPISIIIHTTFFISRPKLGTEEHKSGDKHNTPSIYFWHNHAENISLLVKPLGRISDEANGISEMLLQKSTKTVYTPAAAKKIINEIVRRVLNNEAVHVEIIDFLREKGYALPYKNWSVQELVECGIYKLIKD